ncbi:ATP-dependent DNA helicase RecQ, partial [bacterium]|nr:ATP-dependent DNA helicase RecQ [bacterium]
MTDKQQVLEQLLQHHFGYPQYRPGQLDIIDAVTAGRDALAILPTGGGKSVCFQIPGLYLGGTTLVISPLISLMQDQVANLHKRGLSATFLNSTLEPAEAARREQKLLAGDYQFVYLAPEKLVSPRFQKLWRQADIRLIAIDEAHCVSVWGHDFRPSYLQIGATIAQIYAHRLRPPVMALTATANHQAQADIIKFCRLTNPFIQQQSFARDNLRLCVHRCFNKHDHMLHLLDLLQKYHGQIGIIYALTRHQAEFLAAKINALLPQSTPVQVYHGGLDKPTRARIQDEFIAGTTPVIVATNAFGMGVDQPHVRFVIHAQISSNLENYFQEIGRGGRDGQLADCYALYRPEDLQISLSFIQADHSLSHKRQRALVHKLRQVDQFLRTHHCRQRFVLDYFDEHRPGWHCGLCDNCRRATLANDPRA